jgi:DnaJ like chaperone protein
MPMGYLGKVIGGVAGFAMGGLMGAAVGTALGHAVDSGAIPNLRNPFADPRGAAFGPARLAALLGQREQLFVITTAVLSAKLAKCDGPVSRAEIDAFKAHFRVPPQSVRDIGRLFDQARDSAEGFESYADQLGEVFADNRGTLEEILVGLFNVARADGPVNRAEQAFLRRVWLGFRLDELAWDHARGAGARVPARDAVGSDPYQVLGVERTIGDEALRAAWKRLMRENHPDSLAARAVPPEFIARASEKVARINAAWDQIKRERHL